MDTAQTFLPDSLPPYPAILAPNTDRVGTTTLHIVDPVAPSSATDAARQANFFIGETFSRLAAAAGASFKIASAGVGPLFNVYGAGTGGSSFKIAIVDPESVTSNTMPDAVSANWALYAKAGISIQTYAKLVNLGRKVDGWRGTASKKLSDGSIKTFLDFWKSIHDLAVDPFLTLAPSGNLFAEWHQSWNSHLDIEFADGGIVFFGLFTGKNSVLEGKVSADELANLLRGQKRKPLSWHQKK